VSIQYLLALQLISDIVLFAAVIFLLAIVGRNSWKKNFSPANLPNLPNLIDKQTVAELERLISESQAATAHLIKAMDESRRALKEAVCEAGEKEFRNIQKGAGAAKRDGQDLYPATSQRENAAAAVLLDLPIEKSGPGNEKQSRIRGQETPHGSGQGWPGSRADYQAVIEMARKGMPEKEIIEQTELTEAEISLLVELGRKKIEFN